MRSSYKRFGKALLLLLCIGSATLLAVRPAFAVDKAYTNLRVNYVPTYTVSSNVSSFTLGSGANGPTLAELLAQATNYTSDYTFTVRSNVTGWKLYLKGTGTGAGNAFWVRQNGTGNPSKPVTDLKYKVNNGGEATLSTANIQILTGNVTTGTTGNIKFRSLLSFQNDSQDTYGLTLVFTVSELNL